MCILLSTVGLLSGQPGGLVPKQTFWCVYMLALYCYCFVSLVNQLYCGNNKTYKKYNSHQRILIKSMDRGSKRMGT